MSLLSSPSSSNIKASALNSMEGGNISSSKALSGLPGSELIPWMASAFSSGKAVTSSWCWLPAAGSVGREMCCSAQAGKGCSC